MKYFLLNILSIFILCSCNTQEPDSRTKGKTLFGYKYGEWKGYYFDKTLRQTVNFSWGEMNGNYISYHQVNMLKDRLNFKISKINKVENGEIISTETKIMNPHNQSHMKMDSITQLPIHEIGYFKNGKPEGKFITYKTDGYYEEKTYEEGKITGDILVYNNNGKIYSKVKTLDGKKNGEKLIYDKNGKLITSMKFNKGIRDGETITFYVNGNEESVTLYENGKKISETYFYDKEGNQIEKRSKEFDKELINRR